MKKLIQFIISLFRKVEKEQPTKPDVEVVINEELPTEEPVLVVEEPVEETEPIMSNNYTKIQNFQFKHGLEPDGKVGPLTALKVKEVFSIGTIEQLSNLLGQLKHESANFTATREGGNYSAKRMAEVWPEHFATNPKAVMKSRQPNQLAKSFVGKPVDLFNYVYADKNRKPGYKLGNIKEGDGWLFRGNGSIQTTGRSNHDLLDIFLGRVGIMDDPDLLWKEYYLECGVYYFDSKKLWGISKKISLETTTSLTKSIQGGSLDVSKRHESVKDFYEMLKKYK